MRALTRCWPSSRHLAYTRSRTSTLYPARSAILRSSALTAAHNGPPYPRSMMPLRRTPPEPSGARIVVDYFEVSVLNVNRWP